MVKVTFIPQVWVGRRDREAYPAEPLGETEFYVSEEDATDPDTGEALSPDSYEIDDLRLHANAPKWIREWNGPFEIELDWIEQLAESIPGLLPDVPVRSTP